MQTPETELRRSIRTALVEIPTHLGVLSVMDLEGRRFNNNEQNTILSEPINFMEGHIPPGLLSPSPSPDEMIIRQRGRRRIPVTFSPDIDELKKNRPINQKDRTPVKQSSPSSSSSIVLRSTPRKRLILLDSNESCAYNEQSVAKSSPKKLKSDRSSGMDSSFEKIEGSLKACTSNQLILVIKKLLINRPELEKDLKEAIPEPDLRPLESHLIYLKRNICRALPTNRLCSKTDAIAYHRASAHLANFKKSITDHGIRFAESKQWNVVMDFAVMALNLVRMIPMFDNPSHNSARKQCFKFLAAQCMSSLKHGDFSVEQMNFYESKMKSFISDSEDVKPVLSLLENKVKP